jgi:ABC-type multidrug transport system fused ATPase/permease subunit
MLVLLFLGVSMLDLASLGLIGPYVALIVDPEALDGPLGRVVDLAGLPREQQPLLIALGLMLFMTFLLKAVSAIGINWVIIRFSKRQSMRLQMFLMQSYQALPYTEYLRRNSSEYIHSIQVLTGQYSGVILTLLKSTSDGIVGLVILAVLAWTNGPALALLMGMLGMMVFGYDRLFRKNLRSYGERINRASMQMVQGIREGIDGLKEIRVLGHEGYFLNKVRDGARQAIILQARQQVIQIAPRYLLELMMTSFIVLLVIGMLYLGQNLKGLLPTIGVFGVAALRLMPSANILSGSLILLRFSRDSVSRLYHDLEQLQSGPDMESETPLSDSRKAQTPSETFSVLKMRNLSFRYPNALVDALQCINLQICSGESVGLVGPSGAGKTTLVDVLLGLLEPQSGSTSFNERPLREALLEWRSQAAYLPQQVFLIDNTLKRNVVLGVEDAKIDDTRLQEALRQSRLSELLEQLPNGVETLLGERGVRLSGGQRQRVALARAFYHRRSVLVMDEATSALDDSTEKEIVEEIKHLKGKITMIVIAHRLTTVQHCDRIYRLESGRVIEEGRPEQVLPKG